MDTLIATQESYLAAAEALLRAREARAVAAWRAHADGASYGTLATALGMARPNVVVLVRHGRDLNSSALRPTN